MKRTTTALMLAMALSPFAGAADFEATADKLKAAMKSDIRSEAEVKRDGNRLPVQTMEFFGFRDDMKVVELVPGGGWYTKLLAPTLKDDGEYYAALGTGYLEENLDHKGLEKVTVTSKESKIWKDDGARFYSIEAKSLGVKDADMVLTFRNYHNFDEAGRNAMNQVAFDALKPGGVYAVVDHTARHMEPQSPSNGRRMDPVLAIKEIQAAGFELVDFSNLHYRADDELEYEVGVKSVTGNTDRWTLKFVKPKK